MNTIPFPTEQIRKILTRTISLCVFCFFIANAGAQIRAADFNVIAFYTGKLGIALTGDAAYTKDAALLQLAGAPAGTEFRKLSGVMPGRNRPTMAYRSEPGATAPCWFTGR